MHVELTNALRIAMCATLTLSPFAHVRAHELSSQTATADSFLDQHADGDWRVTIEPIGRHPSFVFGSRYSLPVAPRSDAAFVAAARQVVDENEALFGFNSGALVDRAVKHLTLSRVGSSDKVAVQFDQVVDGIQVFRGTVTILFDQASGDVIALDTTGVPFADDVSLVPGSSVDEAIASAERAYAGFLGLEASRVDQVDVAIVGPSAYFSKESSLTGRGPALAYMITLSTPGALNEDGHAAVARAFISAEGDLELFRIESMVHGIDGKVTAQVNVDQDVPTTTNQETVPLANMYVTENDAFGNIIGFTDSSGMYSTPGAGPTNLFFTLSGAYCRIDNDGPSNVESSFSIPGATGSGNDVLFNPAATEFTTAEVGAYYWTGVFHEWIRAVDPNDFTMEFPILTYVSRSDLTCSSSYNSSEPSLRFGRANVNCANTAYGDVVLHENGHHAAETYNGAVSGAFGEGLGDAYAYYINDDPCLEDYNNGGTCLRNATQTVVKKCPGDGAENCHGGDDHTEGQALASALWSVRDRLNITHGDAAGDAIADALMSAWMNGFFDGGMLNVIADHWLALDDDNGDLNDGTPNFGDVNGGFLAYGWPGFPTLAIELTLSPPDGFQVGDMSPVLIRTTVESLGVPVLGVRLFHATGAGAFSAQLMTPTANPNEYEAQIAGVASPNQLRWYVEATNAFESRQEPPGAPASSHGYVCGKTQTVRFYAFDGVTDNGWTHVNLGGQNGDQWERGTPSGSNEATDPNQAFSPANVWGTDLSLTGFDGKYEPNGSGELRSPLLPFNTLTNVRMSYRRWLTVEEGGSDQAEIFVNGTNVWTNPVGVDTLDSSWVEHDIDISPQAAGLSTTVAWRMTSDGGLEFGGWNLDDVRFYSLAASAPGFIQAYGAGCVGTAGLTPSLAGTGTPISQGNITVDIANGAANGNGVILIGLSQESAPLGFGCTLLLGTILPSALAITLDGAGALSIPVALPPNAPALDLYLQYFGNDPGSANGIYSSSNGLQLHF